MTFPEFLDSELQPKTVPKGGRVRTKNRHREFHEFTDLDIENVKTSVHEMRKTYAGRQALRAVGRKERNTHSFPFIAWDGEGITDKYGDHHYVLFGASDGTEITSGHLTTVQCLEALLDSEENDPDVIHCAFAFNYDVEKILADVDEKTMDRLVRANTAWWGEYRLEWYPRKWFQVTHVRDGKKLVVKVWDLFGFFQTSFVKSLRTFFPNEEYVKEFDEIESGKQKRNQFQYEEVDSLIRPYWLSELKWMVKLAEYLRELLHRAEMDISMWHGPGAIASYLFKKHGADRFMEREIPKDVDNASRHAFAGGRFEQYVVGRANERVYVYDINSAHPTGMAKLPSLSGGDWLPVSTVGEVSDFGVYHIEFNADHTTHKFYHPMPFFYRSERGTVSFPMHVTGYYWQPEVLAAMRNGFTFKVLEGWELSHDGTRPFSWIPAMYDQRKRWQAENEPAQIALKLGLNSLFGKTAQRVGWDKETRQPPKWHQLEWAGTITANTRAILFDAMMQASEKNALLSVETDSVFSLEPLDLDIGPGLGQWGMDVYDDMISIQNGIYWLKTAKGWKTKIRGLDADSLRLDYVLGHLNSIDMRKRADDFRSPRDIEEEYMLHGETTRFITYKQARMRDLSMRGNWETAPRDVQVGTIGKRVHNPDYCYACNDTPYEPPGERFHDLIHAEFTGGHSCPHKIPWIDAEGAAEWQELPEDTDLVTLSD